MTHSEAILAGLQMVPLFAHMEEDELAALAARTTHKQLRSGDVLYHHGDRTLHFLVLLSGWVKLVRTTLDGAEAVLDVLGPGRLVGEKDLFGAQVHTSGAEVVEDGEALVMSAAEIYALLERRPKLALAFLHHNTHEQTMLEAELEHRTMQKAPQRLGCFLLRLVPKAQKTGACAVTLHLPYDKTLLAARLGMQPETFSRALAALKKDLNLEVKGGSISVPDVAALSAYTCSACSGNFPCKNTAGQVGCP